MSARTADRQKADMRRDFTLAAVRRGWTHQRIAEALGVARCTVTYYADTTGRRKRRRAAA